MRKDSVPLMRKRLSESDYENHKLSHVELGRFWQGWMRSVILLCPFAPTMPSNVLCTTSISHPYRYHHHLWQLLLLSPKEVEIPVPVPRLRFPSTMTSSSSTTSIYYDHLLWPQNSTMTRRLQLLLPWSFVFVISFQAWPWPFQFFISFKHVFFISF